MGEGVPKSISALHSILPGAQNHRDPIPQLGCFRIFSLVDFVGPKFGHFGHPEMGEGGPGAILVTHPILTGAQNYGDPISQM